MGRWWCVCVCMSVCVRGWGGRHWKDGRKVTHIPPLGVSAEAARLPAEQCQSASAHCVERNKGGMAVMMIVMRVMMMMALLCFTLTPLPWGIFFSPA